MAEERDYLLKNTAGVGGRRYRGQRMVLGIMVAGERAFGVGQLAIWSIRDAR